MLSWLKKRFDEVKANPYRVTCALIAAISVIGVGKLVYDANQKVSASDHKAFVNETTSTMLTQQDITEFIDKNFCTLKIPYASNADLQYFLDSDLFGESHWKASGAISRCHRKNILLMDEIYADIASCERDDCSEEAKKLFAHLKYNIECILKCPLNVQNNPVFYEAWFKYNNYMKYLQDTLPLLIEARNFLNMANYDDILFSYNWIKGNIAEQLQKLGQKDIETWWNEGVDLNPELKAFNEILENCDKSNSEDSTQKWFISSIAQHPEFQQLKATVESKVSCLLQQINELTDKVTDLLRQTKESFMESFELKEEMLDYRFLNRKTMYDDVLWYLYARYNVYDYYHEAPM